MTNWLAAVAHLPTWSGWGTLFRTARNGAAW